MHIVELLQRISYFCINDKRYRYYDDLMGNIKLNRNEIIKIQNSLITRLIDHAYNQTKYYREVMDSSGLSPGDITNKDELKKLPVLTKSIIRANIKNLISKDLYSKNLIEVTSGGSTGNQVVIYKSSLFDQVSRGASLRNNLLANWRPSDKSVWIWGAPYEHQKVRESFISKLGLLINRRLLFNAYNYSPLDFPKWVEKINIYKPKILYGYASIILEFAKYLLYSNDILPSIKSVVSTTETLTGREAIENAFNCRVFDQYGSREILAIGIESKNGTMMIADDVVALNILDSGEFSITALHSYGFPLINYIIGDFGEVFQSDINDYLPFSSLKIRIGRTTENFLTAENRVVASSSLSVYISTSKLPIIEQQIIQNNYKEFIVNYIPDIDFNFAHYQLIIRRVFKEYFGDDVAIVFNKVEKIPLENSGKKLMCKQMFQVQ